MKRIATVLGVGGLLLVLAAATVHLSLHFNVSQYSGPKATYTVAGFLKQYTSGVYAYRPLARELLLWLNQLLFDGKNLYEARVILNGAALWGMGVCFVLWLRSAGAQIRQALVGVVVLCGLVGLSLYVRSNPYTVLVLAYVALALLMAQRRWWLPMVALAAVGPPLHGMTAIALVAFVLRFVLPGPGWTPSLGRTTWLRTLPAIGAWAVSYVALRVFIDAEGIAGGMFDSVTTEANAGASPMLITAFALGVVGVFVAQGFRGGRFWRPDLVATAALAAPFAALMFFFGRLVEVRLFLPFLVVAVGYGLAASARPRESASQ